MEISTNILEALSESVTYIDWAAEYGEPGYSTDKSSILFANWNEFDKYPRIMAALEEQFEIEWSDEWMIDFEGHSKAYRTQPDSYSWQSSVVWNDEWSDWMTPDNETSDWVEWATNNPRHCIPKVVLTKAQLEGEGFVLAEDGFENGFHRGQDSDPTKILAGILEAKPSAEVVFYLDNVGQFDVGFSVWVRDHHSEDED